MHRNLLLNLLKEYSPFDDHEKKMVAETEAFLLQHSNCFERDLQIGHFTGSAWIMDETREQVLLTHHRKLDCWLQLGGHADGETDLFSVALREAKEESGLEIIQPLSRKIFDLDIHRIPTYKNVPDHLHYDVRFCFIADARLPLIISPESNQLAWVPLQELESKKVDASLLRMKRKSALFSPVFSS